MRAPERIIKSILIIRPGAVGDFILSLPALEFLSSQAESTEVWCAEQNLTLVQFASKKMSIISAGLDRVGVMHCADVFDRLSKFDAIYSWYGTARAEFQDAVRSLPFHFFDALPNVGGMHATDFYCEQVGAPARLPRIAVPRPGTAATARKGIYILHPFASNTAKQWPIKCFRALAGTLADVRWVAGPEDLARYPESIQNPVVIEDLFNLGIWISTARAYIGNDSGITHLAAAVGTPTVAIFGPTDPAVWAPRGSNVRVVRSRSAGSNSIQSIDPREVAAAVYDL